MKSSLPNKRDVRLYRLLEGICYLEKRAKVVSSFAHSLAAMIKLLLLCLALASVGQSAPRDESKFSPDTPFSPATVLPSRVTFYRPEKGQWVSGVCASSLQERFYLFHLCRVLRVDFFVIHPPPLRVCASTPPVESSPLTEFPFGILIQISFFLSSSGTEQNV